jgi:hypothetical protein
VAIHKGEKSNSGFIILAMDGTESEHHGCPFLYLVLFTFLQKTENFLMGNLQPGSSPAIHKGQMLNSHMGNHLLGNYTAIHND